MYMMLSLASQHVPCVSRVPGRTSEARLRAQVWAAPLLGGARAVVLFNRHVASDDKFGEHNMTVYWSMVGLPVDAEASTLSLQ